MDETENVIKEYFDALPESFKKTISSFDWQKKVTEIGQKYTLSETQIADLNYEVLFVLVGIEDDDSLGQNIQEKLGVSEILSEELTLDIEDKVLKTVIDLANKEDNKKVEAVSRSPIPKVIVPQKPTDLPLETKQKYVPGRITETTDFAPDNLPVSVDDEKILHPEISIPKYIPTKVEEVRAEADKKYEDLKQYTAAEMQGGDNNFSESTSRIKYRPAGTLGSNMTQEPIQPQPARNEEYVQKPQSVPRLNFNSEPIQGRVPAETPPKQDFESKWNDAFKENSSAYTPEPAPTSTQQAPIQNTPPQPRPVQQVKVENPIEKSYSVDPYREPIE